MTDISNPHHAEQDAEVEKVLAELGVADRPRLRALNKTDLLAEEELGELRKSNGNVYVSALRGTGLHELLQQIDTAMPVDPVVHLRLSLPMSDGRTIALIYALGRVLHSEVRDSQMLVEAEVPSSLARRLNAGSFSAVSAPLQ